ncbi:MAG: SPASM domain-containing protein [Nitrospinales bacterium]
MYNLQISTKIGCNNNCYYCPQDKIIKAYKKRSKNVLMHLDNFKSYLNKIPSEVDIWFAGMCEPWMNPDCSKMIAHADSKGHKICIFTTLMGMTLSDIDIIESVPFKFFQIHLPSEGENKSFQINNDYLTVLEKISKSRIMATYHCHNKKLSPTVQQILAENKKLIEYRSLYQRSGNIRIAGRLRLSGKQGKIGCRRQLRCNVLLPNGDVILCSNDYGMKHILGNIGSLSYDALFKGDEFQLVLKGLQDETIDTICRECDNFSYDVDVVAKIYNFSYRVDKYLYYIKQVRSRNGINVVLRKGFLLLRKWMFSNHP